MVVAAVIERDGDILVCQRRQGDRHALKWEFPGGKVEPGETPRAALKRELVEELLLDAIIGPEIVRYEYRYPGRSRILLVFHRVNEFAGEPRNRIFEEIRWERRERLPEYDFLEGDRDFVRRLSGGEF
jgi:8-oxo-dGTP diphosphatase